MLESTRSVSGRISGRRLGGRIGQEVFALDMPIITTRAPRYPIPMPLRYRKPDEAAWHDGKVENISRTGVLFTVEGLFERGVPVELTFQLPVQFGGRSAGQVLCQGRIVRVARQAASDGLPAMAAQIESYKLFPGENQKTV